MRRTEGAAPGATTPSHGLFADYRRLLADPTAPALCVVHPASARGTHPRLMSLDLIDYGVRKCINAAVTGTVMLSTAPLAVAVGLPIQVGHKTSGIKRVVAVPLALPVGLAVGCLSGVASLVVRGMAACFGMAAALVGAACLPIDLAGTALQQLAATFS